LRAIALGALLLPQFALADAPIWRVLLVGDDLTLPASIETVGAMRQALVTQAGRPVEVYEESIDVVRFTGAERAQVEFIREKYRDVPIDLLMAFGPQSLRFVQEHGTELHADVPVVFFGVMAAHVATPGPGSSGMTLAFDLPGTVELMRRLHPDRRHIVVVAGTSRYDRGWIDLAKPLLAARTDGVTVSYLTDRTLEETARALHELPRDAVVLYLAMSSDADGARLVPRDIAKRIANASTAPVYGVLDSYLGQGVVGGSTPSFVAHARAAAGFALRVLNGDATTRDRIEPGPPARCAVDARALARWRIAKAALPPGCEVEFETPSYWQLFRWQILGILAVIALQAALIAALLLQRRRLRSAALELHHERTFAAHAASLAMLGELSASIAHEVSQPLGAILSNADAGAMLLDSDDQNRIDEVREILADIRRDDLRAREVVRRVRALAQRREPELKPLDLNDVVADVCRLLEADAARRGAAFELDLDPTARVHGDRVQLQLVLANLVLNAIDAMEHVPVARRRVQLQTRIVEARAEVRVSDAGPGISKEKLPHLFESFFTTKPNGVGLGLSIARTIVTAHGGRIYAVNQAEGATFTVDLPGIDVDRERPSRTNGVAANA